MALVLVFLLGIGNFAVHQAVLRSGHPLLGRVPWFVHLLGGRATLASEFAILLAAMLLAGQGWTWAAWVYAAYSVMNGVAAWLILTRRV